MSFVKLMYGLGIVAIVLFFVLMFADMAGVMLNFWTYFSMLAIGGIMIAIAAACDD